MSQPIRLGLIAVASPLEAGAGDAPALLMCLEEAFRTPGAPAVDVTGRMVVTTPDAAAAAGRAFYDQRVDAVIAIAASWFEDYLVLDLLEECPVPVVAWARPGMETGSLCGMQQLCFMLKQLGRPYLFLFDEPRPEPVERPVEGRRPESHPELVEGRRSEPANASTGPATGLRRARAFIAAAGLARLLRRARIGHLGHRVEGMTETTAHELALKRTFGPRVVGLDTTVFLERAAQVDVLPLATDWGALSGQVGRVTATVDAGIASLQVAHALRATVAELGLSAVSIGCYPHLMGKVCLAASLLGEEGVPVACEGDINAALGMLMLTRLTGQPVHNTDLLDPIPAENAIVFSHCGSGGFSLAANPAEITLGPVRLMDRGLCCLFPARPGPVTLLNIVPGLNGYRMAALHGEAIATEMVFPGNPLRVRFKEDYRAILGWIAREGLGHHWMAGYGDLRQPLADLAGMVGCEMVLLTS